MQFFGWLFLLAAFVGAYFWIGAAALAAVFVVGSWPFLAVLALALGAAWYAEAHEEGVWAIAPFAAFCLFVHFVSQVNVLQWGRENLGYLASRVGIYLALGFAYAIFRWVLHLRRKGAEVDELVMQFRERDPFDGPMNRASDDIKFRFTAYLEESRYSPDIAPKRRYDYKPGVEGIKPLFGPNKYTFGRWFWWWPFSLVGWAVNDFIREVWDVIKQGLEGVANRLSGLVFGNRSDYVLTDAQVRAVQSGSGRKGTGFSQ